ncbi:MAG: AtpZ/AtpI family protein [Verrucomicrobia bacterium]|nr:AtpZ/AtpI family protein [Verrucomicrobiota bacterium]
MPKRDDEQFGPLSPKRVADRAERLKRAREEGDRGFWQNLGLIGSVGWMIILPAVGGSLLGRYIDGKAEDPISWTLTLLVVGLVIGCVGAWQHMRRER